MVGDKLEGKEGEPGLELRAYILFGCRTETAHLFHHR